ncbi:MAG: Ig-like domain-containing protein [Blautia faecis]
MSYTEKADKVTYKSSNKKIATVSKKGVIKGKKKVLQQLQSSLVK